MAAIKEIIRDFTLFIDGVLFQGDCESVETPNLQKKMEEYRGGGMPGSVEVALGYEKMRLKFSLTANNADVIATIGMNDGDTRIFKIYKYMQGFQGAETNATIELQGEVCDLASRTLKSGEKVSLEFEVAVSWYKEAHNGAPVLEYNPLELKLLVKGNDVFQRRRQLLGLA